MHRKILMGLAPLLAAVALAAVVTDAAVAVPLNFSNGAKLKESNGVFGETGVKEVIGWGTVDLKCTGGACGVNDIKCHNAIGGFAYNPIGGTAGKGATQAWGVFDCETNLCAAGTVVNVVPEELPWLSELTENGLAKTGLVRSHTEKAKVDVTCNGLSTAHFFGSNQPGAPAGEDKGTTPGHPGFLEFDQPGSGTLSEEELAGQSATTGAVHELGYTEQELLQVKCSPVTTTCTS
jgi:hypothetical protein